MAEIEVPHYKTLAKLPSLRKHNFPVQEEINKKILIPKGCKQSWASLFDHDKMYWFTMMTREEYNTILDDDNVPQFCQVDYVNNVNGNNLCSFLH